MGIRTPIEEDGTGGRGGGLAGPEDLSFLSSPSEPTEEDDVGGDEVTIKNKQKQYFFYFNQ